MQLSSDTHPRYSDSTSAHSRETHHAPFDAMFAARVFPRGLFKGTTIPTSVDEVNVFTGVCAGNDIEMYGHCCGK